MFLNVNNKLAIYKTPFALSSPNDTKINFLLENNFKENAKKETEFTQSIKKLVKNLKKLSNLTFDMFILPNEPIFPSINENELYNELSEDEAKYIKTVKKTLIKDLKKLDTTIYYTKKNQKINLLPEINNTTYTIEITDEELNAIEKLIKEYECSHLGDAQQQCHKEFGSLAYICEQLAFIDLSFIHLNYKKKAKKCCCTKSI